MSTVTTKVVKAPARSQPIVISTTTSTKKNAQSKKQPPKGQGRNQRPRSSLRGKHLGDFYVATLNDPFNNGPVKLGFGTMTPTSLATAYSRTVLSMTDGTFAVVAFPTLGTTAVPGIYTNVSGAASTGWGTMNYVNRDAITTMMAEARVVSLGVRVIPLVAATETAGVVYAGSLSTGSIGVSGSSGVLLHTPTLLQNLQSTQWGVSKQGIVAKSRPVDNAAFEFAYNTLYPTVSGLYNNTIPYICGSNFPTTGKFVVEVTLNLEGIGGTGAALANDTYNTTGASGDGLEQTLTDFFPSIDAAWTYTKSRLSPHVDFNPDINKIGLLAGSATALGSMAYGRFSTMRLY